MSSDCLCFSFVFLIFFHPLTVQNFKFTLCFFPLQPLTVQNLLDMYVFHCNAMYYVHISYIELYNLCNI